MRRTATKVPSSGTSEEPAGTGKGLDRSRLFAALRRVLRARGVTYAELARRLGMSESGVKKIFSIEDCSIARLDDMARAVGFSLDDLFDAGARPPIEHVALTDPQQRALLASPLLLAVFWKLSVERWTTKRIGRELGVDAAALRRAIGELDRLDLVILEQPGDRVRLRHGDLVRWLPGGPLLDHLHAAWGRDVLDRARATATGGGRSALLRLHQIQLRRETRAELETELAAILDGWIRRAKREALTSAEGDAPPHGLLLAMAEGSFVRAATPTAERVASRT
jgi:transcriptional regulator with XRE-family HTH domain